MASIVVVSRFVDPSYSTPRYRPVASHANSNVNFRDNDSRTISQQRKREIQARRAFKLKMRSA